MLVPMVACTKPKLPPGRSNNFSESFTLSIVWFCRDRLHECAVSQELLTRVRGEGGRVGGGVLDKVVAQEGERKTEEMIRVRGGDQESMQYGRVRNPHRLAHDIYNGSP